MGLPQDYVERVYAGVLGKIIGVYLGRPFEQWSHERILSQLGEISYYVHEKLGVPLIVTDDDISGTFTFLRALPDYGNTRQIAPEQIGQTWLNYIIESRAILWWGGMGNSTEHTAYLRLKHGIPAPESGSMAVNSRVVAEQIGAQIFIDAWAMVAPGDPEFAADLARRAGSVSHDGEALYGAQVIAAMESQAFVESDLNRLLDTAVRLIPADSLIYRLIADLRDWHAGEPDWRKTRQKIAVQYGYDTYGGNCHIIPNHALIHLGLLYGGDDFQKSLMIVNTSGWDTDCNSGNVGCLLGIKNGLAGVGENPDWRGPVADRLYLATADGGRSLTDAVTETYHVVNIGRALHGEEALTPKNGARFHFELPGAVQGFIVDSDSRDALTLENVAGHSRSGTRSLALRYRHLAPSHLARAATPTFIPPEAATMPGYQLLASPTLYPGQTVRAALSADAGNPSPITSALYVRVYGQHDQLERRYGPTILLTPGSDQALMWRMDDTGGLPVAEIGVELRSNAATDGRVYLDYLTWDGEPEVMFRRPAFAPPSSGYAYGAMWFRAWVDGVDHFEPYYPEAFRIMQDEGRGLAIQGAREWRNYRVSAEINFHMAAAAGIGARVQGMRRYYALLLCSDGAVRLVKALDGDTVLAENDFGCEYGGNYRLALEVNGACLRAWVDDRPLFDLEDTDRPLDGGGIALVCEEGRVGTDAVTVSPAQ
jgi:ADP-ribosylglycohydrolase